MTKTCFEIISLLTNREVAKTICEGLQNYCSGHTAIGVGVCVALKAKELNKFDSISLHRLILDEVDP